LPSDSSIGKPKIAEDRLGRRIPSRDAMQPIPFHHRERRALEVHAQLLPRDQLVLLRPGALAHLLGERGVRFEQAVSLRGELAGELVACAAGVERVHQRLVHALVHVRKESGEEQDHAREEELVPLARGAKRHGERHEPEEGDDLVGEAMRRVIRHGARHEERHQHHHREALDDASRLGQQHRADRHPAQGGEQRAAEEALLPVDHPRRIVGHALDERLVDEVAADGHQPDGDEPGEKRRPRGEVFPENRAEDEHHQQRREVADQRKAEQQADLLRMQ
jgi:hypothetical protein